MARGSLKLVEHLWFNDLKWNLESPSWMWNEKDALSFLKNFNISFVFAMLSWKLYITLYINMYKNWKGRKFVITWWIKVATIFHISIWLFDLVKVHGLNNIAVHMNGIFKIRKTNIWTWTLKPRKIGFVDIGHFYKKFVIQGILQIHNIIQGFITIEGIQKYILW
jgi:hypothetical protein